MPRLLETMVTLLAGAARVHFGIGRQIGLPLGLGSRHVRVAPQITILEHEMEKRITVIAAEPIPPIVAVASKLRLARFRFDQPLVGLDPQIVTTQVHLRAGAERPRPPTAPAVRAMQPVVQAPAQAIDAQLQVAFAKATVENFALISFAVSVGAPIDGDR